jgi:uncharacterized membrane protein YgdD (TMEM256/DUF423 family)
LRDEGRAYAMWLWNETRLNRIGLICGLLSFWLAAPELLGEDRLRRADERLRNTVLLLKRRYKKLHSVHSFWAWFLFIFLPVMTIVGVIVSVTSLLMFGSLSLGQSRVRTVPPSTRFIFFGIGVVTALLALFAGRAVARAFRDSAAFRKRALVTGGVLFLIGWIVQLAATYAPSH